MYQDFFFFFLRLQVGKRKPLKIFTQRLMWSLEQRNIRQSLKKILSKSLPKESQLY